MKETTVSTPMRHTPAFKGTRAVDPKTTEANQYYDGKGPRREPVPQPKSYEGTGVSLGKKG